MNWDIKKIELIQVPLLLQQLSISINNGDPNIDDIRCIYKQKDDEVIYTCSPFELIDLSPTPIFTYFAICRMIKN